MDSNKINIDQPLWDQSTYIGRWKHYVFVSDARIIFEPTRRLLEAKQFCDDYKNDKVPPGTTTNHVIYEKKLKDSSFHPDDGHLIHMLGRMYFQLPANVLLTTAMLTFYKTTTSIVTCQAINQTHNAILNYCNRSMLSDENSERKLSTRIAFLCAVLTSSVVAVGCRKLLYRKGSTIERCVPFIAVAAGHVANLPLMRQREIARGTPLFMEGAQKPFMESRVAAVKAISECVITRIAMCVPCLLFIPLITQTIKPYCFYQRRQWILYPLETIFCAIGCLFAIPSSLAIFPRHNSMNPEWLRIYEPEYKEFREKVKENVDKVYYCKGL